MQRAYSQGGRTSDKCIMNQKHVLRIHTVTGDSLVGLFEFTMSPGRFRGDLIQQSNPFTVTTAGTHRAAVFALIKIRRRSSALCIMGWKPQYNTTVVSKVLTEGFWLCCQYWDIVNRPAPLFTIYVAVITPW